MRMERLTYRKLERVTENIIYRKDDSRQTEKNKFKLQPSCTKQNKQRERRERETTREGG